VGGEEQDHCDDDADQDVGRLLHPEHRQPPEQQVAHRAAADAGHRRQQREAEDVHLLARRDERTGRGEHRDAEPVERHEKRGVHAFGAAAGEETRRSSRLASLSSGNGQ
jgi:hypothetical protein